MSWSNWMSSLNDVLADLYPTIEESRLLVGRVGMKASLIPFNPSATVNWFNILQEADKPHANKTGHAPKAMALLECALQQYPEHDILLALRRDEPPAVKGPEPNWIPSAEDADNFEKIIGKQSTLLPIHFLEGGLARARSVARVLRSDKRSGSGFLIGGGWLLTNNHVLPSISIAQGAVAEFNYQRTEDGLDAVVGSYSLDPARFHTNKINDWTLVGINASAEAKWGWIKLHPVSTVVDAFVNIIQHPGGGPKQIALYHNTVAYVGAGLIQYLTDTLPGSSGSPVFNEKWEVVALHHSGGMLREPGTKNKFYRNEGIAVTTLLSDFQAAGIIIG